MTAGYRERVRPDPLAQRPCQAFSSIVPIFPVPKRRSL